MNIYTINKSTVLEDAEIQAWIPAFHEFIVHVRRYWPRPANIIWCPREKEPTEAWKLIFADTSDEAGALGYHDFTPGGRPISYVFAQDDIKYGYSPTVTATHEIAEMIADPWISENFQVSDTQFYAKEIADPVEADELGYQISIPGFAPVLCSDFVLPNWFIPGAPKKYDFLERVQQPLGILTGGYMSIFVSGTGWTQIYAKTAGTGEQVNLNNLAKTRSGYSRLERYARNRPSAPLSL